MIILLALRDTETENERGIDHIIMKRELLLTFFLSVSNIGYPHMYMHLQIHV